MKSLKNISILALFGVLSACTTLPQSVIPVTTTPQPPSPTQPTVLPAVASALTKLAGDLSMSIDQITIVKFEAKDWPDGCLGAPEAGEMCTQVVTPGYQVVLQANDITYTFRTNADGSVVRAEPKTSTSPIAKDLPEAVLNARKALAKMLGVTPDALQVVSFEAVDWPNGCLGVQQKGMMCTDMVTPGYLVIFKSGEQQWEYHTDKTGVSVVLAKTTKP